MTEKDSTTKKIRGMPTIIPRWWLREIRIQTASKSVESLTAELNERFDRKEPWTRETVGKFLKNKFPTFELMIAFCRLCDVPPPIFVARTIAEAHYLARETRKYDDKPRRKSNPEKEARITVLDENLDQLEQTLEGHRRDLDSYDEGISDRRRVSGVVRGRKPTS